MREEPPAAPDPKDQRIGDLERQWAEAQAAIRSLRDHLERLQVEVETLKRAGKRQAVPFARRQVSQTKQA